MSVCPPSFFTVDPLLKPLMETYCLCPAAAAILNSAKFPPKVDIKVTDKLIAYTLPNEKSATIYIPKTILKAATAINSLVVELFNAQKKHEKRQHVDNVAALGYIAMNTYALLAESLEQAATWPRIKLHDTCEAFWGKDLLTIQDRDPHLKYFELEVLGHTNSYRNLWIDRYQKAYCKKNPHDASSCSKEVKRQVDSFSLKAANEEDRDFYMAYKICELYPCAHENVKNFERYRRIVAARGTELMGKNYKTDCKPEESTLNLAQQL